MAAAGFIPVVGWAGRAIKGGSALYKTAKGLNAADHALDAYKTTKGFSLLQKTEYGIYGLLAANGLGEAATGKDMFGNQLTEEQRQNGLLMALGIGGVAGAAKIADKVASGTKFIPYSKEFAQKQVQKAKAFGRQIGNVEVPLRIRVEELATAYGNNYKHVTFDKTTIKDIVQKFAVKSDGGKGLNGTGSKPGINIGKEDLETLRIKLGVPETQTIAIGKTDVKGLEGKIFEGGSPKVRKEAGLPDLDTVMPNRPIKSPSSHPLSTRHAEEGVINEFILEVERVGLKAEEVTGTLNLHQSNPKGACTTCIQGIVNPNVKPGIFMQLSKRYPELTIKLSSETVEGVKPAGKLSFILKNVVLIE
jgi:hypothetical protein